MTSLFQNLLVALLPVNDDLSGHDNEDGLVDPFHVWFTDECAHEMLNQSSTMGQKLGHLLLGGIINGLAGFVGGMVNKNAFLLPGFSEESLFQQHGITFSELKAVASVFLSLVETKLHLDRISASPEDIRCLLAPGVSVHNFLAIRRRVYKTAVLGNGVKLAGATDKRLAIAPTSRNSSFKEKDPVCKVCKGTDFRFDRKNGDVTCTCCGVVAHQHIIHEGSQFRIFEGEADRNHHGPAFDPLFSNSYNMSTCLSSSTYESNGASGGSTSKGLNGLRKAHAFVEANLINLSEMNGNNKEVTRQGYKDKQKREAFVLLKNTGEALDLNVAVVERAKELFACFRDDRDVVKDLGGVLAACLCEALEHCAFHAGTDLLELAKRHAFQLQKIIAGIGPDRKRSQRSQKTLLGKTIRRKMLHDTSMAIRGKNLDLDEITKHINTTKKVTVAAASFDVDLERKPLVAWNLNDIRSWLLYASRVIVETQTNPCDRAAEELEAVMMKHTMSLCELLQSETEKPRSHISAQRAAWRRDDDTARSGVAQQPGTSSKKSNTGSPGKQMLLLNVKKLDRIFNGDRFAATSIHQMLRGLVRRQSVRSSNAVKQKASRVRFQQIKRSHWLSADLDERAAAIQRNSCHT